METMAYKTDEKARGKRTISKLRAKVDPIAPQLHGRSLAVDPRWPGSSPPNRCLRPWASNPRKKHRGGKAGDSKATRQHQSHW